ncbi:cadherin-7a isoform X1 [Pristis pectinata]|uniref:cadherin-7a isoform X1 n=1 Tax=Pristis pectinata TaxID=685728 RepID=UPI00223E6388|nr:cadherin-7a isoform X1 [Pristis pectinata]
MKPRDSRFCRALAIVTLFLGLGTASQSDSSPSLPRPRLPKGQEVHRRVKRGWVWNQFFVLEEYTGTDPLYVGKLHSDVDRGDGSIKYVLSGEGAGSIFIIDESTGDIHATKRLDREEQAYYALRAQAVDRLTNKPVEPLSEFIVKIQDINDNEPRFLDGPYLTSIPEMSPVGTSVIQVTATDADDPTYGSSARVVYSILQGQPYFSVEPKTGIIKTALPNMDREAKDRYLLVIQAKDMVGQMGGLSGTTSITVTLSDVNDNPPRFSRRFYQYNVPESLPVASTVAKIKALDDDIGPNAEMEYRIIDGDGLSVLQISTDKETQEGIITLQKELDFEKKSSYSLKIEVTNTNVDSQFEALGPFTDTATVKLVVEDVDEAPVFNSPLYKMSVSEAARVGTAIGTVSAHDPDMANNPVRYSIDRNTDLERYFNIDANTGVITIAKSLDRETNEEHNITVLAMESQNPAHVGRGSVLISLVDVNDNVPEFPMEYETFVCENTNHGKIIQKISAVDRDKPPSGHHFYFSLAPGAGNNLNFTVQDNRDNTAVILTRRDGFSRHEQAVYFLPIVIVDNGAPALSSTNTLTVRVCSCDDEGVAHSCNAEAFALPAGLSTGALIAILACVLTLLVLVLLIVTLRRRKKESLVFDEEKDIRENIVRYDDEGGGEEDTEAFDMAALRNLNFIQEVKTRRDVTPEIQLFSKTSHKMSPENIIFGEFIWERMKNADTDPSAPPYDSLQTYAFEGNGSVAESLSSLESISSASDQNYDYLSDWGPRFKKLADMYGSPKHNVNS